MPVCFRDILGELRGGDLYPDSLCPPGSSAGGRRSDAGIEKSSVWSAWREGKCCLEGVSMFKVLSSGLLLSAGQIIKL